MLHVEETVVSLKKWDILYGEVGMEQRQVRNMVASVFESCIVCVSVNDACF